MRPRLAALVEMVNQLMPHIAGFVVLRYCTVHTAHVVIRMIAPKRARGPLGAAVARAARVRDLVFVSALSSLVFWSTLAPPLDACLDYEDTRVHGACALLAIAVILTCNKMMPSVFALGALMAVGEVSPSAPALAALAACASFRDGHGVVPDAVPRGGPGVVPRDPA